MFRYRKRVGKRDGITIFVRFFCLTVPELFAKLTSWCLQVLARASYELPWHASKEYAGENC